MTGRRTRKQGHHGILGNHVVCQAGSHLVVSHPTADMDPAAMTVVATVTRKAGVTFVAGSAAEIGKFFGNHELVEPGLVPVLAWRPDTPAKNPKAAYYLAGVARKPEMVVRP